MSIALLIVTIIAMIGFVFSGVVVLFITIALPLLGIRNLVESILDSKKRKVIEDNESK